ncbi:hypothetical protein BGZ73_004995 [Actinomortierella ambigua]|nr:hypothetical protein BGZ73_004995 [Actinomortierella ambigua]
MGLSKQLSLLAHHILPVFTHDNEHGSESPTIAHNQTMNNNSSLRAIGETESAAARRIRQQHPYHPHYQHNLAYNDTPSYSTPPSLSSSPTYSSPSSTASSSSAPSSAPHSGITSPTIGYPYQYQQAHYPYHQQAYPYQPQGQQQSSAMPYFQYNNCHSRFGAAQTVGPKGGYSYHRNQSRYQRRKAASTSYYYVDDDDDMMVGYEGHHDDGTHMSDASTPMALPQQQQKQTPKQKSDISKAHDNGSCSRPPAGSHAGHRTETPSFAHQQQFHRSHLSLLSNDRNHSIGSEPNMFLSANDETIAGSSLTVVSPATATATQRVSDTSKTAQRSLRRIAQCSIDSDDWCSAKAGQYTRSYADSSLKATSHGEGRRMRRM